MAVRECENLDIRIEKSSDGYQVRVWGPAGEATSSLQGELTEEEFDAFLFKVGLPRRRTRRAMDTRLDDAKRFGGRLYETIFQGAALLRLRENLAHTSQRDVGLRIRLRLSDVPELAELPWEFLYDRDRDSFLALSAYTPIIRYLELPDRARPLPVSPPLRVLVVIPNPRDRDRLDSEREWNSLQEALKPLVSRHLVQLERLGVPHFSKLRRHLRENPVHVLHFIGHGDYDDEAHNGELVFEDEHGKADHVSADQVATVLNDHRLLRLVVLNSCEGARASRTDPFSGTAQALVQRGLPAVIAMQFEITDQAAITLSRMFYDCVAIGFPIDISLAEARKEIYAECNKIEWATPVLYLRGDDGRIFDVARTPEVAERIASKEANPAVSDEEKYEGQREVRETAAFLHAPDEAASRAKPDAARARNEEEVHKLAEEEAIQKQREEWKRQQQVHDDAVRRQHEREAERERQLAHDAKLAALQRQTEQDAIRKQQEAERERQLAHDAKLATLRWKAEQEAIQKQKAAERAYNAEFQRRAKELENFHSKQNVAWNIGEKEAFKTVLKINNKGFGRRLDIAVLLLFVGILVVVYHGHLFFMLDDLANFFIR